MKLAIIETGGKQYRVAPDDMLKIEKLAGKYKKGDVVAFDKVLLLDDGADVKIGTPYLDGVKIEGTFEEEGKGKKISVIKFKSKIRYHKKYGHRQPYTKIKIT